ncbi:MAG: hemolysin family protein [Treponema sp.]|jgi:CBS domain containing-hemolysin-like protein|nr:hemolysin family protein [Treponema sp.]
MDHVVALIVALLVLLLFSGFFSACETAFSSASRIKLKNLAGNGDKRAKLVLQLIEKFDRLLSTVLIGNNIVNITSSALATVLFVGFFGNAGVSIATLVTTVLVLIFGEISPKTLAKESPERISMAFAPVLRFFMILLNPVNRLISHWRRFLVSVFRVKQDRSLTEDELLTFVEEVAHGGGINEGEEEMIRQVIEFDDITAREICTPRLDITAVSLDDTVEEIEKRFAESDFSRLPVYRDSIDNITGVLLLKDFYREALRRGTPVETLIKPVLYVSSLIKIHRLLHTLQQKQSHLAVLVDEYGGTVGIVTMEDIMEELVGEIWDEHDEVVKTIKNIGADSWSVLGTANLEDVFEFFGVKADTEAPPRSTTVASWVLEELGRLPRTGDSFVYGALQIRVSRIYRRRVMEVTVRTAQAAGITAS